MGSKLQVQVQAEASSARLGLAAHVRGAHRMQRWRPQAARVALAELVAVGIETSEEHCAHKSRVGSGLMHAGMEWHGMADGMGRTDSVPEAHDDDEAVAEQRGQHEVRESVHVLGELPVDVEVVAINVIG